MSPQLKPNHLQNQPLLKGLLLQPKQGQITLLHLKQCRLMITSCYSTDSKRPESCCQYQIRSKILTAHQIIPISYNVPKDVPKILSLRIQIPILYVFPWAHPSPQPKRHLDQFSHFSTSHKLTVVTNRQANIQIAEHQ